VTTPKPVEIAREGGLAYALWLPADPVRGAVVILHGAGSCKESHYDYARALLPVGIASIAFDQRGHGDSDGPMDGRALEDVGTMAALLRTRSSGAPLALRGSSMGGYLALAAAASSALDARAVVAICPASGNGLRRAIRSQDLRFPADVEALDDLLADHDLFAAAQSLEIPVLLLHASGDEVVPIEHSRELATHLRASGSRLIEVPGGHHRSVQHDEELQAVSIRFLEQAFASASPAGTA
jgi:alpha-beta hydrolase superfamily lysophospholipase